MNHEEFEHKLRSHDPAANLEARDTVQHRELFDQAISGQPANVISISRWTKRRKAVSAAAVAILIFGVGGPVISGATSASSNRLVFGESQTNMAADKSATGLAGRDSAMGDYYMGYWGFYHYELSPNVTVDLPTNAPAYKVVNISNIDERVQEIANALGVKNLVKPDTEDGVFSNSDVQTSSENFYAWTAEGSGSFSYFNAAVDPWRNCYKDEPTLDSEPKVCDPISNNLYTEAEAKAAAKELLSSLGFEAASLRFETYASEYGTDVYVTEQVNGMDSPISYYISYVANGDLYSFGGSLTKLVEVGSYDLINVQAAITRANSLTNRTIDIWNENNATETKNVETGSAGTGTSNGGTVSEPSTPSVDPSKPTDDPTVIEEPGPQPAYTSANVTVTKVALGYQMFWMQDKTTLWLPVINFFGTSEGYDEVNNFGSVVAVVDSQIDLESLYMSMGMLSPLSRSAMID